MLKIITQSDQEGSNNPRMKARVKTRGGTQKLTRLRKKSKSLAKDTNANRQGRNS